MSDCITCNHGHPDESDHGSLTCKDHCVDCGGNGIACRGCPCYDCVNASNYKSMLIWDSEDLDHRVRGGQP